MRTFVIWLSLLLAGPGPRAWAQVSAVIDIDTAHGTALNPNFSGFNDEVTFPVEYFDYRFNNLASRLSPGWVRYPAGMEGDAFDWSTGLMVPAWAARFQGSDIATLLNREPPWVNGKGGASFVNAALRAEFLGAKLIVCFNAFTDTPASAGRMAAFAKANRIPVAAWELANEPYFFKEFFSSGADYVAKVKPFRDAIKAADPDALVAISFTDAGNTAPDPPWDRSIAAYPDKYWDAVAYHHYPPQSSGDFSRWMADGNATLASRSTDYVTRHLAPMNPPGMKFLISEFLPSSDGLDSGTSLTDRTLYGAIYAAEYVMRMSTLPSVLYVGPHALSGMQGINAATPHYLDVQNAYYRGTAINTVNLNFGFYLEAQPLGVAVLNGVLRNAVRLDATTVSGGAKVPATGLGQVPALYAQAYTAGNGQHSVVITNKGATAHQVALRLNGTAVAGVLPLQLVAGADPTLTNTAAKPNGVAVQASTSANPVTVPAYSVVRVDLNPPAAVTVANSASYAVGFAAPEETVTLSGPGFTLQAAGAPPSLPADSGATSVQVTDSAGAIQPALLVAVSSGQATVVMPDGLAAGQAAVTVLHGSTAVSAGSVAIVPSQPGLYSANQDGSGVAMADAFLSAASSDRVDQTVSTCNPSAARSCVAAPLSLGEGAATLYVELYGTGIRGAAAVECYVAGQTVPVLYAGPASDAGMDRVEISIPRSLAGSGAVRVYVVADGAASNVVYLSLR